ncbi:autophagy- protein 2 [Mitosporidium daphniae]
MFSSDLIWSFIFIFLNTAPFYVQERLASFFFKKHLKNLVSTFSISISNCTCKDGELRSLVSIKDIVFNAKFINDYLDSGLKLADANVNEISFSVCSNNSSLESILLVADGLHMHINIDISSFPTYCASNPKAICMDAFRDLILMFRKTNLTLNIQSGMLKIRFFKNDETISCFVITLNGIVIESSSSTDLCLELKVENFIKLYSEDCSTVFADIPPSSKAIFSATSSCLNVEITEPISFVLDGFFDLLKEIPLSEAAADKNGAFDSPVMADGGFLNADEETSDDDPDNEIFYSILNEATGRFQFKNVDYNNPMPIKKPAESNTHKFFLSCSRASVTFFGNVLKLAEIDLKCTFPEFLLDKMAICLYCSQAAICNSNFEALLELVSLSKSSSSALAAINVSNIKLSCFDGDSLTPGDSSFNEESILSLFYCLSFLDSILPEISISNFSLSSQAPAVSVSLQACSLKVNQSYSVISITTKCKSASIALKDLNMNLLIAEPFSIVLTFRNGEGIEFKELDLSDLFSCSKKKTINVSSSIFQDQIQSSLFRLKHEHLHSFFQNQLHLKVEASIRHLFVDCDFSFNSLWCPSGFTDKKSSLIDVLFDFNVAIEHVSCDTKDRGLLLISNVAFKGIPAKQIYYCSLQSCDLQNNHQLKAAFAECTFFLNQLPSNASYPSLYIDICSMSIDGTNLFGPPNDDALHGQAGASSFLSFACIFQRFPTVFNLANGTLSLQNVFGVPGTTTLSACDFNVHLTASFADFVSHSAPIVSAYFDYLSVSYDRPKTIKFPTPIFAHSNFYTGFHLTLNLFKKQERELTSNVSDLLECIFKNHYLVIDSHSCWLSLSKEGFNFILTDAMKWVLRNEEEYISNQLAKLYEGRSDAASQHRNAGIDKASTFLFEKNDSLNAKCKQPDVAKPATPNHEITISGFIVMIHFSAINFTIIDDTNVPSNVADHVTFKISNLSIPATISPNLSIEYILLICENFELEDHVSLSTWRTFLKNSSLPCASTRRKGNVILNFISSLHSICPSDLFKKCLLSESNAIEILVYRLLSGTSMVDTPTDLEFFIYIYVLQKLRFHIDQDSLFFLESYFSFSVNKDIVLLQKNIEDLKNQLLELQQTDLECTSTGLFFRHIVISEIELFIDYKPKKSVLSSSSISSFVFNIFKLEDAKIVLQSVHLHGIHGIPRAFELIMDAWIPYVTNTQAQQVILNGWTPIRTMVQFGNNVGELIMLPMNSNPNDGSSTSISLIRKSLMQGINITSQLASTTKNYLKKADSFLCTLSGVAPLVERPNGNPKNLDSGIKTGVTELTECLDKASLHVESEERINILKAVPLAFVRPLLGVTKMVDCTVSGLANTLDQNRWSQKECKYKKK